MNATPEQKEMVQKIIYYCLNIPLCEIRISRATEKLSVLLHRNTAADDLLHTYYDDLPKSVERSSLFQIQELFVNERTVDLKELLAIVEQEFKRQK